MDVGVLTATKEEPKGLNYGEHEIEGFGIPLVKALLMKFATSGMTTADRVFTLLETLLVMVCLIAYFILLKKNHELVSNKFYVKNVNDAQDGIDAAEDLG